MHTLMGLQKMNMFRFFSSAARNVSNSELAQLRKKTGFALINCRKALQLCDNDLVKAEEWLQAEAKKLGWEKASKLQGRSASEGLIAIARKNNKLAMVEVNCETDFVARNKKFISLTHLIASVCLTHCVEQMDTSVEKALSKEEMSLLQTPNNENLNDCIALSIGELGENIVFKRAFCYGKSADVFIDVAVHPPTSENQDILTGKYGVIVAYQKNNMTSNNEKNYKEFGINLCQHIIGMNPKNVGSEEDAPSEDPDEETVLIHQEYLLDSTKTVSELLEEHGVTVLGFKRFQCGEIELNISKDCGCESEDFNKQQTSQKLTA